MGRQVNSPEHMCIIDIQVGSLALLIRLKALGMERCLEAHTLDWASQAFRCGALHTLTRNDLNGTFSSLSKTAASTRIEMPAKESIQDRLRLWLLY